MGHRYSPDGRYLAVGTHGSVIVLCDVARGYTPIELNTKQKALDGHNSALLQLDWSADGKFIRSNCRAYELLFWTMAVCLLFFFLPFLLSLVLALWLLFASVE